jgi:hypothetical protein
MYWWDKHFLFWLLFHNRRICFFSFAFFVFILLGFLGSWWFN